MTIKIKRVYEEPLDSDGERVLIDRLWPRGLTKEKAKIDLWIKEIAPSTELRKWFRHEPAKWEEFKRRYLKELIDNEVVVSRLKDLTKGKIITLVYGAKDEAHNNAVVLKEFLEV